MNIAVIHTRSNDGASKGCVERLFKTMEGQTILELVLDQVATLEGVQEKVDEWATTYILVLEKIRKIVLVALAADS